MPSDERVDRARTALAGPREDFLSALADAAEVAATILASRAAPAGERVARATVELGAFARGRLDAGAFAGLFSREASLDPAAVAALEGARGTLEEIVAAGDGPFRVTVAPGGDLSDSVGAALAELGRGFAAARTIRAVAAGGAPEPAGPLPFRQWRRAERALAPPLVVELEGADLAPAALTDLLDGSLKLVLVVRGPAPPAALARLVSPGVFVAQLSDPAALERAVAAAGPAIAALVPDSTALFVHDPAGGASLAERLTVERMPAAPPRGALRAASAFRQAQDLEQLAALAAASPAPGAPTAGAPAPAAPAERLAAWLLARTDLAAPVPGNGAGG